MNDTLVSVEHISKKFCTDLKRSLRYGVHDLYRELTGRKSEKTELRKKEFWALKDVSFTVKRGEVLGLVGHNGAGKTTLLRMLNGLIKPDAGKIIMRGRVGALIQLGAGFNPVLTGRENVYINAAVLGISKKDIDKKLEEIIEFAAIGDFIDAPVQAYSSGMVVRLGFSVAINLKPDIMLVDEVLAVGDISFRNKCLDAIQAIRDSGVAFVFVSHNLDQVDRLCDKAILLKKGQVIAYGPTADILSAYVTESTEDSTKFNHMPGTENYLQVLDIQILDHDNRQLDKIVSGASVIIRMTFEAKQHLTSPGFIFMVEPSDRQIIAAYLQQDKDNNRPSFPPGKQAIEVYVESLSLLPGRYQLRLSVVSANHLELYGKIFNLASLKIVARENQMIVSNSAGFVELKTRWQAIKP